MDFHLCCSVTQTTLRCTNVVYFWCCTCCILSPVPSVASPHTYLCITGGQRGSRLSCSTMHARLDRSNDCRRQHSSLAAAKETSRGILNLKTPAHIWARNNNKNSLLTLTPAASFLSTDTARNQKTIETTRFIISRRWFKKADQANNQQKHNSRDSIKTNTKQN